MGSIKLFTGIFVFISLEAFKNHAPTVGLYFAILALIGFVCIFYINYKKPTR
jgi:hypothetical protein